MHDPAILYPVFALALWTGLVLMLIPLTRIRAGRRGAIVAEDFKFGESARVPPAVSIPNRNYMNLLELPVLFYVVCLLVYVAADATALIVEVAWAYVGLRVVHSAIHLTYNTVTQRLFVFAISNSVLVVLWVLAWTGLRAHA